MKFNVLLSAAVIVFVSSTAVQAGIDEVSDIALSKVNGQFGQGRFGPSLNAADMQFSRNGAADRAADFAMEDNPYHVTAQLTSFLPGPKSSSDEPGTGTGSRFTLPSLNPTLKFAFDVSGNDMLLAIGLPKVK